MQIKKPRMMGVKGALERRMIVWRLAPKTNEVDATVGVGAGPVQAVKALTQNGTRNPKPIAYVVGSLLGRGKNMIISGYVWAEILGEIGINDIAGDMTKHPAGVRNAGQHLQIARRMRDN